MKSRDRSHRSTFALFLAAAVILPGGAPGALSAQQVPNPKDVLGFTPGYEYTFAYYAQLLE
jgi:hypothetical protein